MTADPIRDALREAVRAMNGRMADRGYEVPWPEDGRLIAAAAVVAFLRALPDETPLPPGGAVYLPRVARELFAAAVVERAAKEGA